MSEMEEIAKLYEPKIRQFLGEVDSEAKRRGYVSGGVCDLTDEEYRFFVLIRQDGKDHEEGVDVTVTITESEVRGGKAGGLSFMLDVVAYGGEILGGFAPYNYTEDVWVPAKDKEQVEQRWGVFIDGVDIRTVVDTIDEFVKE